MNTPLVSVIVPVYNVEKTLTRCLESICGQSYQNLEIIVVNDGSPDGSLAICEQFRAKDPRVVVISKENEGLSLTRNAGMRAAHGKYLQFVDSDDYIEPILCLLFLNAGHFCPDPSIRHIDRDLFSLLYITDCPDICPRTVLHISISLTELFKRR